MAKIEAQLPDGTILEFPEGTPDSVIDSAVRAQINQSTAGDIRHSIDRANADRMRGSTPSEGEGAPMQGFERPATDRGPPAPHVSELEGERIALERAQRQEMEYSSAPQAFGESDQDYHRRQRRTLAGRTPEHELAVRHATETELRRGDTAYVEQQVARGRGTADEIMRTIEVPGGPMQQGDISGIFGHHDPASALGRQEQNTALETHGIASEAIHGDNENLFERLRLRDTYDRPDSFADFWTKALRRTVDLSGSALGGVMQWAAEASQTGDLQMMAGDPSRALALDLIPGAREEIQRHMQAARDAGELPGQSLRAAAQRDLELNEFSRNNSQAVQWVGQLTDSVGLMAPTIAISLATRNPMAGAAAIGLLSGGEQFAASRQQGRTYAQSNIDGIVYGLAESIPEVIPLGAMMRPGGRFLPHMLGTAGLEGASEVMTQIVETGYDMHVLRPDMTFDQAMREVRDAGIVGFFMGAGMHSAAHPFTGETGARAEARRETAINAIERDIEINRQAVLAQSPQGTDPGDPNNIASVRSRLGAESPLAKPKEAFEGESTLTPEDRASPIPDEIIARGRAAIERSRAPDRQREQAQPPTRNTFERMVQITLGAESGNRDRDAHGNVITSPAGARGRMQVLDSTNRDPGYGVRPAQNDSLEERARVGRDVLHAMLNHYGGDPAKMWAAYNWGPGNLDNAIRRHGDHWLDHAPAETRSYVMRNLSRLGTSGFTPEGGVRSLPPEETATAIDHGESAQDFANRVLGPNWAASHQAEDLLANDGSAIAAQRTEEIQAAAQALPTPEPTPGAPLPPPLPMPTEAEAAAPPPATIEQTGPAPIAQAQPVAAPAPVEPAQPVPAVEPVAAEEPAAEPAFPKLDTTADPEVAARRLAVELVRNGFGNTNGFAAGYTFEASGSNLMSRPRTDAGGDVQRFTGDNINLEVETPTGRQVFSFKRSQIEKEASQPGTESAQPVAPVRAPAFDPESSVQPLQAYVQKGGSLDPKAVGKALNLSPAQAGRVMARLVSRPNSGLYVSKSGRVRRVATAISPVDAIRFLRNSGGIINDPHHDLMKGRNWHKQAPGLINNSGMTIDEAGRRLWEAGFMPNLTDRPTEAETLEFIERAFSSKAYRQDDLDEVMRRDAERDSKNGVENADYAIRDFIEEEGLDLAEDEYADALDYMSAGENAAAAVQRALYDASKRTLHVLADETGNDFYESAAESVYEGEIAEQRDSGGPDEGSVGPEGVQADSGERAPPGGESGAAGPPQDVETRAGVGAPAEEATTPPPAVSAARTTRPHPLSDEEFKAIWQDKAFKAFLKAMPLGPPHRESGSAHAMARGWRDGKTGKMAPLDAYMEHEFSPFGIDPARIENGFNPVDPYIEGFYGAVTGMSRTVRTRGNERLFGVAQAATEIEQILAPEDVAARRAEEAAESGKEPAAAPAEDMFGTRPGDERTALEKASEGRKKGTAAQKAPGSDGGLFDTAEKTGDIFDAPVKTEPVIQPESAAPVTQPESTPPKKRPKDDSNRYVRKGEKYRFTKQVGYLGGGAKVDTNYTVESASLREAWFANDDTGGRSNLPNYELERALKNGDMVKVEPVAEEKPAARPAGYGAKNKIVTAGRANELRAKLKAKLGGAQLNAGLDPELIALGTELAVFHIEAGARKFADFASAIADDLSMTLAKLKPYLRGWYNGARDMMEDAGHTVADMDDASAVREALGNIDSQPSENRSKEASDVPATSPALEPDRSGATAEDAVRDEAIPSVAGEAGRGSGIGDGQAEGERGDGPAREGKPSDGGPVPVGERGDSGVRGGSSGIPVGAAESGGVERSGDDGERGRPVEHVPAAAVARVASNAPSLEARRKTQAAANKIAVQPGIDNVRETLPYLRAAQQDDVHIVETRFAKPDGHGMLLTNGTGTGKTFVGGGVAARMYRQGKTEQLIIVPSQDIAESWKAALHELGVPSSLLESTDDKGNGVSITTYANFYQNQALGDRTFDLVIPDEAQKLSSNKAGEVTSALKAFRALTKHPSGLYDRAKMSMRKRWAPFDAMQARWEGMAKKSRPASWQAMLTPLQLEVYDTLAAETTARGKSFEGDPRTKALFLSATPWSYVESVDWAEGFLFEYGPDSDRSTGYNQPDAKQAFFIQHFGYRMRNNKLTKPEAEVDSGVMERQFNEWLKGQGALAGRTLDVDADYDRKFVLVDDAIGNQIDQALEFLSTADDGKFGALSQMVSKRFDYLSRMRLLEAIKAQHAIPMIREYIKLGRKVVVFHDYNEGGGFSPFLLQIEPGQTIERTVNGKNETIDLHQLYQEFLARNPYVAKLDFSKLPAPLVTLTRAFPDAIVYNGTIPARRRREGKDAFNKDGKGTPHLIIIQSAAGEYGISAHDTTGNHMRMTVNLGMPVRPTTAIQEEGRTRRDGSVTDAGYRYLNTGTAWERWTFAGKIAERASTAENLALGNDARKLKQSFIDAFADSAPFEVTAEDGKGGKEADHAANTLTPFQQAKSFYWAQQKKTGRRDQRDGIDYFATPEPLGLKMVEWANIRFGEKVLEPSAGHGAIARFLPESADRTLIEPSSELLSRAALASPGSRTLGERFEDLNVVNKYDAIVMNPPFGMGGKTAIEHLAKAATHLRNGGRIVALVPEGPAADKRFEAWFEGETAKALFLVSSISLPPVTFSRAGTQVRSRVLIIEKQTDPDIASQIQQSNRDVSNAETINELFDRIEEMGVRDRLEPKTKEAAPALTYAQLTAAATPPGDVAYTNKPTFDLGETKHGKTGEPVFVASITERVDRSEYDRILARAKHHGGYYSFYRGNGAIPGFQFKGAAARQAFVDEVGFTRESVQAGSYPFNPTDRTTRAEADNLGTQRQQAWDEHRAHALKTRGEVLPEEPSAAFADVPEAVRAHWFAQAEAQRIEWENELESGRQSLEARGGRIFTADEVQKIEAAESPPFEAGATLDIQGITELAAGAAPAKVEVRRWIVRDSDAYSTTLDPAPGNKSGPRDVVTRDLRDSMRAGQASEVKAAAPKPTSLGEGALNMEAAQPTRSMQQAAAAPRLQPGQRQGTLFSRADGSPRLFVANDTVAALRAQLRKMNIGDKVILETINKAFITFEGVEGGQAHGTYMNGIIQIAMGRRSIREALTYAKHRPMFTLNHEAIHALRDLGLFKGDEWRALMKAARADGSLMETIKRRYPELPHVDQLEEAVADMYARWQEGRHEGGFIRAALQRIKDFLTAIHRAIGLANVADDIIKADAESVMEDIDAGVIGARQDRGFIGPRMGDSLFGDPQTKFSRPEDEEGTEETRWLLSAGTLDAIRARTDQWRTKLQDRMLPLLRTQQRIEAQSGTRLPDGLNPYMAEELMTGKVGSRLERLTDEMANPLFESMKRSNVSLDELETYLYARHAPERNARIADINPDFEEGSGSGMTDEDAAEIMAEVERQGKAETMERLAARVDDILKFAINNRVESGLLSKEEATTWSERYEHYVPLRGMAEVDPEAASERPMFGSGINVRGPESRMAFGRRSRARNILAYTLLQAEESIVRSGINEVGQAFYGLALANPDANFWRVDKISRKPALNRDTGQVYYRIEDRLTAEDAPYTVSLKIEGQEHRVTMNRENSAAVRLAAAMRNLHGTQLNGVMRVLSGINRFLSTVNTTLSPEFIITNAFRDIQTASVNLAGVDVKGLEVGTLRDYKSALVASVKGAFGKGSGEWSIWYNEFVAEGGRVYFNRVDDLNELQRRIEKHFKRDLRRREGGAGGAYEAARAGGAALFGFIENANLGVENAIRLAAYKNARERGMTKPQAASLAKNLTVNFNRRGEWGTAANALYLFYNASVQGSARMIQAMGSKRVRRIMYGAIVAGFLLDLLNSMGSDDDDDGQSFYDKISDFDKSRNLIFMIPGGHGQHIRIPLPYGYNIFFSIGRSVGEIARNPTGARALTTGGHLLGTIADAFNPIGGTNSLLNFIAPTVADPVVDLALNRDFASRPIMPDQQPHGPQEPDSQRYWGSVSPHWRAVTDTLNSATGGDTVVPGFVDISPETLEYLGGVVTGSAGNFFERSTGLVEKVIGGQDVDANDIPLVRRVVGSPPRWFNKSAFYARVGQVEQAVDNVKSYRDNGREDAAAAYAERNSALLDLQSDARSAQRLMRQNRHARGDLDHARDRGEIDSAGYREQRRALQEEEDSIVTEFNRSYLQVIESPTP